MSRPKQPWVRFHIASWLRATRGLSLAEEGIYIRLLSWVYEARRPLPADRERIYAMAGARRRFDRQAIDRVLDRFFNLQEDGWHNAKADEELARYRSRVDTYPTPLCST